MSEEDVVYYVGGPECKRKPLPVYSEIACRFLDELSVKLRENAQARQYSDIMAFAFWCRRGNVQKQKLAYADKACRFGRGLIFHIAPSNVPINFAYSFAFGLLAGNGNIVRVSGKDFEQTRIVCREMQSLLQQESFAPLRCQNQVISYGHNKEKNDYYSALCDGRVIWGGDRTIAALRESPIDARCVEVTFADRYSFGVFDEGAVLGLSEEALLRLAEGFYNDTYLMDQNACSSPHLIVWMPAEGREGRTGSLRFWDAVSRAAKKYPLTGKKAMDKYLLICEEASQMAASEKIINYGNLLNVVQISRLPETMDLLRGRFGLFYEMYTKDLESVFAKAGKKVQTCVYFGLEKEHLLEVLQRSETLGIDRIVPVGKALEIGTYWDGYDIIGSLSRKIELA